MNFRILLFCIPALFTFKTIFSQKTYSVSVSEFIISYGTPSLSYSFKAAFPNAKISGSNLRFTAFFHVEEDWHIDINNNFGFITGIGIRNIGMSTDEILPVNTGGTEMMNYKIIRRVYTFGIPLSVKLGSFKNKIFFYAGGEYELAFHFKEKYWSGSHNRSGNKTSYTQWLGDQTPLLLPSFFTGVQLKHGIGIKFRYYLKDFLNSSFTKNNSDMTYNVSDLSRYETSDLFYFALTWFFDSDKLKTKNQKTQTMITLK